MVAPSQRFALSSAQQGLWFAQAVDPTNPIFNTAHYAEIQQSLQSDLFLQAIQTVVQQADGLRLRIDDQEGIAYQYFDAPTPPIEFINALSDRKSALALMQADQQQAIDLRRQSAARFILFELDQDHYLFYMRVHHLAADGYAMNLLESRIVQHYHALITQQSAPAALSSITDVIADDLSYQASEKYAKDRAYWLALLHSDKDIASLADQTALSSHSFLYKQHYVGHDFSQQLVDFAQQHACSWADVLTLLTAAYIARHTGQYKTRVGVPYMGRMGNKSALSIATVMNVAPLQLEINEKITLSEFLQQGSRTLMLTRRHGRYRSEQLRRDLGLLSGMRRLYGPLINILPFDTPYDSHGINATSHVLCAGPVEDLNFSFRSSSEATGMRLEIEANPALYQSAELSGHTERLLHFIQCAFTASTLAEIPTVTDAEFQRYVFDLNATNHPIPSLSLSELCQNTALEFADQKAISDASLHYNYQQYQAYVDNLALRLEAAGIKAGDRIAVALPRSAERVMLLHAIMRAQAAYLPLDASQPKARLLRIVHQAQVRLCISNQAFATDAELGCPLVSINALPAARLTISELAMPDPDDDAYVLFTSGSTGDPKGVVIQHKAIVNRLLWMRDHYQIKPGTRFMQKTPYTFDVSLWELFLPFISGAHLFVAPSDAHKDPYALAQLIKIHQIDVIHFVPSMLSAFLASPASRQLAIPFVFCSGEALSTSLRSQFYERIQGELHNLYGPTEAAVDVSYWHASRTDTSNPIPIGFPVWNTTLYVLDEQLRPVPAGVGADLYLGGIQLASGYLHRPDLTKASFLPHPFAPGQRIYKTGDKARWRPDGAIEYLGRADHQVKLRGLRIELGEIEAALLKHAAIEQAIVHMREDQPGQQLLVAYVVSKTEVAHDELLQHCRQWVPEYMVPNTVMLLEQLPLNSSGKLDRNALPAPQRLRTQGSAPQSPLERRLAHHFKQVLQLSDPVFLEDNFFTLGGHSLLAAQLIGLLREEGFALSLGAIFAYPSLAQLAQHLEHLPVDAHQQAGFTPVLTLHKGNNHHAALFCIHPAGGLSWCYGALARSNLDDRPVYGLQAATFHNEPLEKRSIAAIARNYVDTIQSLQADGPYHLLGWSVGGILAHAIAVELRQRQAQVGVLCLLDAYPSTAWRNQPEPAANAIYKALLHIAGFDPNELPHVTLERRSVIDFLRDQGHPLGELADAQLNGVFNAVALNNQAVREHQEQPYDGSVLYFHAGLDHKDTNLDPRMWLPWVKGLELHSIDFLHAHLTSPQATACIYPLLRQALLQSEQQHMAATET